MSTIRQKSHALIERAEKILQTDVQYLISGGFWLSIGKVASMLSTFLLSIAFANLLTKETYGSYKYILSIAATLSLFTLPGMNTALTQSVARGFEGSIVPATKTRIKWASIGSLFGLGISAYFFLTGNPLIAVAALILACFLPFMDTFTTYSAFLLGRKQFKTDTIFSIFIQIISSIAIAATIALSKNLLLILCVYFGSYTLMRFSVYKRIENRIHPPQQTDPHVLSYGKHLSVINILGTLATNLDDILSFHFLGPAAVAMYNIATAPFDQARGLLSLPEKLIFPQFAKYPEEDIRKNIRNKFIGYGILSLLIMAGYWAVAPWFFSVFLSKYVSVLPLSLIYSLSILTSVFSPAALFLSAKKKVKEQYICNTTSYIFQILSMVFLTIHFGLPGLVGARILSKFFSGSLNLFFYLRPLS